MSFKEVWRALCNSLGGFQKDRVHNCTTVHSLTTRLLAFEIRGGQSIHLDADTNLKLTETLQFHEIHYQISNNTKFWSDII